MKNILNPKWLLIINSLPISILFFLLFSQYKIIKTLLNTEQVDKWKFFGIALLLLTFANLVYTIYAILKEKFVSVWYAFFGLVFYLTYVYLYLYFSDEILPSSIPNWMISYSFLMYTVTFLMPTFLYCLFVLVFHFTPHATVYNPWISFIKAISIPILAFLFIQIVLPVWNGFHYKYFTHVAVILLITCILTFIFFLIRFFMFCFLRVILFGKNIN
jgi:hypothetical protein